MSKILIVAPIAEEHITSGYATTESVVKYITGVSVEMESYKAKGDLVYVVKTPYDYVGYTNRGGKTSLLQVTSGLRKGTYMSLTENAKYPDIPVLMVRNGTDDEYAYLHEIIKYRESVAKMLRMEKHEVDEIRVIGYSLKDDHMLKIGVAYAGMQRSRVMFDTKYCIDNDFYKLGAKKVFGDTLTFID